MRFGFARSHGPELHLGWAGLKNGEAIWVKRSDREGRLSQPFFSKLEPVHHRRQIAHVMLTLARFVDRRVAKEFSHDAYMPFKELGGRWARGLVGQKLRIGGDGANDPKIAGRNEP